MISQGKNVRGHTNSVLFLPGIADSNVRAGGLGQGVVRLTLVGPIVTHVVPESEAGLKENAAAASASFKVGLKFIEVALRKLKKAASPKLASVPETMKMEKSISIFPQVH